MISLRRSTWLPALLCILGMLSLVAYWWSGRVKIAAGANDFLMIYAGARLAGTPQLYDSEARTQVQIRVSGHSGAALEFTRLPFYSLFLWPLGRLPYRTSYLLFQALSLCAITAFVFLWRGTPRRWTAVACCWSSPLSSVLAQGQDVSFLLVWLALAVRWEQSRPWLAGLVLSLCAAKFHFFVLLPVWLAARGPGGLPADGWLEGRDCWRCPSSLVGRTGRRATRRRS